MDHIDFIKSRTSNISFYGISFTGGVKSILFATVFNIRTCSTISVVTSETSINCSGVIPIGG